MSGHQGPRSGLLGNGRGPRGVADPNTEADKAHGRWARLHFDRAGSHDRLIRRVLEIGVGLLTWSLLMLPLWGPMLVPIVAAALLAAFSLYWLYRSCSLVAFGAIGMGRLRSGMARDWRGEVQRIPGWERVRHLVIFPTYLEPVEVLVDSLEHLERQDFPLGHVAVVVAFEERDSGGPAKMEVVRRRFGESFDALLITSHPDLPGEVRGKSANLAWAAPLAKRAIVDSAGLDPAKVVVTVCDADSRLHPKYLSALTHAFLSDRDPVSSFYQPLILAHANIEHIPPLLRTADAMYSLTNVARSLQTYKLLPLSTYSLSLDACVRVGYWDPDVIPEDSHMFFKIMLSSRRAVRVRPVFVPVWGDAADGGGFWPAAASHYRQFRRWAWGVSDVGYIVPRLGFPWEPGWWRRLFRATWYMKDHLTWSVHGTLLTVGLNLVSFLAPAFWATPLATTFVGIFGAAITACFPCLVAMAFLDYRLRAMDGRPPLNLLETAVAWALMPAVGLLLISLPAVDAHTRVLIGRPLAYQVTIKVARSNGASTPTADRLARRRWPSRALEASLPSGSTSGHGRDEIG